MRHAGLASLVGLLATASCSDGVGRPILAAASGGGGQLVVPDAGNVVPPAVDAGSAGGDAEPPGGDAGPPGGDVPPGAYCAKVADPPPDWAASELTFFRTINEYRAGTGHTCGGHTFGNLPPLVLSPALRCSARLHALDIDQVNPDTEGPSARMAAAGFTNSAAAEDIALGEIDPVLMWPAIIIPGENPQGCALADPALTFVGIGRSHTFWAVDVARP